MVVVFVVAVVAPAVAHAARDGLFAPSSYRNTPLPPDAPVDPLSGLYVTDLALKASLLGAHVMHDRWSVPVYTVPPGHPTTRVRVANPDPVHGSCGYGDPCLAEQWRAVPLPDDAEPSPGGDGWLVVHQPSTDTVWEFWRFGRDEHGPHAVHGGRIEGVGENPGHFTDPPGRRFGASATSIPLLVGVQRIDELRAGEIDHIVSFAMNTPQRGFRPPAQRGDGLNPLPIAAKEGTCFRFPASLDLDALGLTPYGRVLAEAIQRYGMVLTDQTGPGVVFFAEIPTGGEDPYHGPDGIFGSFNSSAGPNGVLRGFPWSRLQALAEGAC